MGLCPIRKPRRASYAQNPSRFAWLTCNITSITLLGNVLGDRTVCAENDKIRNCLHQFAHLVPLLCFVLGPQEPRCPANH